MVTNSGAESLNFRIRTDMQCMRRWIAIAALGLASLSAYGQIGPEAGSHLPSQAAADVIRDFAGTEGAFLAGGLLRETYQKSDLSTLVQPVNASDNVVVMKLTGAQVRQAFERSVSLYPQPNSSFLQISGFEATFSKSASPGQRILSITAGGTKLDDKRAYTVAMPSSLARGGLGYFKIWDTSKIAKTFDKATLESVLKGKHYSETSPRWSVAG